MEDEEEYGALDPAAAQSMLCKLTARYGALDAREAAVREQVERSRAERLRAAQEQIRSMRFGDPTRAEQLFALSSAFLSPKPYRGFAGTLANIVPTLGAMSSARSDAEAKRAEMLAKLEQDYAQRMETQDIDRVQSERENLIDLMKVYGPLAKPKTRPTDFNPVTGRLQYKDTGEEVVPPPPAGALQVLRDYVNKPATTPQNRQIASDNFERRFNTSAAQVLQGGR